ncbi:MAG: GldG family protein [Candidatus Omnitrophica bacterium]|nr:GldG family protein [Candidatus Omnitrophota bacterium]
MKPNLSGRCLSGFLLLILAAEINWLAAGWEKRWDFTRAKQHTLSDTTRGYLRQLQTEVKLTAFYVGLAPRYIEDLFREYERLGGSKVKAEIIDPLAQISYAAQFGHVINGKEQKVFVTTAQGRKIIDFTEQPLTEEQLTNEIVRLTRPARKAYFLTGHGEYRLDDETDTGLSKLAAKLAANHFRVEPLFLEATTAIPRDCDILIIPGPHQPLPQPTEEKISAYLRRGGDALFLIENILISTLDKPLTAEQLTLNPSLNGILREWGLQVNDDVVIDLDSHVGGDVGCPATRNYLSHRAIVADLDYTYYIRPRSISLFAEHRPNVKVAPLVLTASKERSWGETNRYLTIKYDPSEDRPGPVMIAFVAWEPRDKNKDSDTRLAVFTDADFLSNAFIDQYSNAAMALNVINWVSEADYQVFLGDKKIKVSRLDLTNRQKQLVVLILILLPLTAALAGLARLRR